MQGLIDLTQKGFFPEGSKVLYAHLGGAPALNGYSYHYEAPAFDQSRPRDLWAAPSSCLRELLWSPKSPT